MIKQLFIPTTIEHFILCKTLLQELKRTSEIVHNFLDNNCNSLDIIRIEEDMYYTDKAIEDAEKFLREG